MSTKNAKALAVMDDLFFMVKINDAAKRAGVAVEFVKSEIDAVEGIKAGACVVILDLNFTGVDAVGLIGKLKGSAETRGVPLVGYVSHVQGELKRAAQNAGCDMVVARSAFSQNLARILGRYAEEPR